MAGDGVIRIEPIRFREVVVTIEGLSSLLCDQKTVEMIDKPEPKSPGAGIKPLRKPRDYGAMFQSSLYEIAKGLYGFPGSGIKTSLTTAGSRFGGQAKTQLNGIFVIPTTLLPIEGSSPVPDQFVGTNKGIARTPDVRCRSCFDVPWRIQVPVDFVEEILSEKDLLSLFVMAGRMVGIGNWRPEKGGDKGCFQPTKIATRN